MKKIFFLIFCMLFSVQGFSQKISKPQIDLNTLKIGGWFEFSKNQKPNPFIRVSAGLTPPFDGVKVNFLAFLDISKHQEKLILLAGLGVVGELPLGKSNFSLREDILFPFKGGVNPALGLGWGKNQLSINISCRFSVRGEALEFIPQMGVSVSI